MSKSIFISHAVADSALASELVELLESGAGLPEDEIFCSSLVGHGIPAGENFIDYIKKQITAPDVVILLLTPSYFASNFCLCELGAAWVKSHRIFPILVPPLQYEDVKGVLTGVQVIKVDDDIRYNEIREYLLEKLAIKGSTHTKWDVKRKAFLLKLPEALAKLEVPLHVTNQEFSKVRERLDEATTEYEKAETEISRLKAHLVEVEKLKDVGEVAKIRLETLGGDVHGVLDALTTEVTKALSKVGSQQIKRWAVCDYYGAPYRVEHQYYGDQYEDAARRKLVKLGDEGDSINWTSSAMKSLRERLDAVDNYVAENHESIQAYAEAHPNVSVEPDSQDFWEYWDYF